MNLKELTKEVSNLKPLDYATWAAWNDGKDARPIGETIASGHITVDTTWCPAISGWATDSIAVSGNGNNYTSTNVAFTGEQLERLMKMISPDEKEDKKEAKQMATEGTIMPSIKEKKITAPVWNAFPIIQNPKNNIVNIKILAKDKVVSVEISDGKNEKNYTYKQICREPDTFSLRYALALALTKHWHRKEGSRLTSGGLQYYVDFYLKTNYDFNKEIDRALKFYNKTEREKALAKAKEEEIKAIKARRAAKQKRNRERRKARREQR